MAFSLPWMKSRDYKQAGKTKPGALMYGKRAMLLSTTMALTPLCCHRSAVAQASGKPLIRLAEVDVDPQQIEAYKMALMEEIQTSIRVEPGVLTLYAVSVKGHPEQIRLFEQYRDEAAYQAHLQSPHFQAYKSKTQHMVKALRLVETEPLMLGSK